MDPTSNTIRLTEVEHTFPNAPISEEDISSESEHEIGYSKPRTSYGITVGYILFDVPDSVCNEIIALTIAFRFFAVLLAADILSLCVELEAPTVNHKILGRLAFKTPKWRQFTYLEEWASLLPASVAAAMAIPLLMQAILHMPSLPVLVMLFPLAWVTDRIILVLSGSVLGPTRGQVLGETGIVVLASSIILYDEYRLMVPGIIFGVAGIIATGASKAWLCLACRHIELNRTPAVLLSAHHGFVILTAIFGLVITGLSSYAFEFIPHPSPLLSSTSALLFINIGSTAAAILSGTSLLVFSPILFAQTPSEIKDERSFISNVVASSASSVLIFWLSMLSDSGSYVSLIQHIAYYTAMVALLAFPGKSTNASPHYYTGSLGESERISQDGMFQTTSTEVSRPTTKMTLLRNILLGLTLPMLWLLVSAVITNINEIPPDLPAQLDRTYVGESRFDIVVSMYDEDPASVKTMLALIRNTALLKTIDPRVIIYTKKPVSNLDTLRADTGVEIVEQLENLGREGGTYLHHIVTKWDTLATQTMFIQAHPHNMRELIPRIDNYLVENTGMLSLGFAGVLCNCDDCGDRWGWEDQWAFVPSLYQKLHHNTCTEPVLLSYKGQFVASAGRIRGVPLDIYQNLLDAMSSTTGWSHNSLSFTAVILTLTFLAGSGFALPTLDKALLTHAATINITHNSDDTHRIPSTINTDASTNNQISIASQPEEPIPGILLVQSLPFPHNITLPVSIFLAIVENSDLSVIANPICPGGQKPYTLVFNTPICANLPSFTIETHRLTSGDIWPPTKSGEPLETWSLMFKCALSETKALRSLPEPRGLRVLNADRTQTNVSPIINRNEAGLVFNPPSRGIRGPQVNKISVETCIWSSVREAAIELRLLYPIKCPAGQQSYTHLFTQRECRGTYVLSEALGLFSPLFDPSEDFEAWSILFICADRYHEPEELGVWETHGKAGISSEMKLRDDVDEDDEDETASTQTSQANLTLTTTS
ncbi:hypothetical protein SBOR_0842 [Sclerotinia borealis F-4128]|uniref:Uncharacterized protein n=1 Tax=Sclerotinia borealis (strain F-4128) TaxID=1432307 RepID=W9CRU2_SCLBF|nr:hypothetical protein SBOR_0842 [Sclerotinia borealis F-4128]